MALSSKFAGLLMKQQMKEQGVKNEPEKATPIVDKQDAPRATTQPTPPAKVVSPVAKLNESDKQAIVETIDVPVEVEGGPMGFQVRLDRLDELIQKDQKVGPFIIDAVRSHVKQIMIDLKEQPELDACLIDRDVHNIMRFIRSTKNDAIETREVAKGKRETKETKKKKRGGLGKNFSLGDGPLGDSKTLTVLDLEGFAKFEV